MKNILTTVVILLAALAVGFAVYGFVFRKSIPAGTADEQVATILAQNDCYVCHAQNPDLPFYSKLPVVGPMVKDHAVYAYDFVDLLGKATDPSTVDEVTLAMIDHSVTYDTMPTREYRMVHWGTGFNDKEKAVLAQWILDRRGSTEPVSPIPSSVSADILKADLGKRLFNDARLSLDGTITCATCHVLEKGGADHADERVSEGINGLKGGVNAPTVYNATFYVRQFWNGRAADLREQAEGPATNPVEMGDQTFAQICGRLSADKELVKEFEALFPGEGMTPYTVTSAIAEFEKTLVTPDSRFDKYLGGDGAALSEEELRGYEAFKRNSCAACHVGTAMGGQSFEKLGIYGDYFADRPGEIAYNSDDDGLKGFSGNDADLHRYKVPTLRNIALTAPYFHDGQYQTLEEATQAMAKYELGKELSDADLNSIVAFMKTLTGKHPLLTVSR